LTKTFMPLFRQRFLTRSQLLTIQIEEVPSLAKAIFGEIN